MPAAMRRGFLWAIAANAGLVLVFLAFSREAQAGTPEAVRGAWSHGVPHALGLLAFLGAWLGVRASVRWLVLSALALGGLVTYVALVFTVPLTPEETVLAWIGPVLVAVLFFAVPLAYLAGARFGGGRPKTLLAVLMLVGVELARSFYLALTGPQTHFYGLAATLVLLLALTADTRREGRSLSPRATRR